MNEQYHINPKKTADIDVKTGYEFIPESPNFKRNMGVWTLHFWKGDTIQSENLNEFINVPGIKITNSLHHFGYKFNNLNKIWKVYNFMTKETL